MMDSVWAAFAAWGKHWVSQPFEEQLLQAGSALAGIAFVLIYWTRLGQRRLAIKCLALSVALHALAWSYARSLPPPGPRDAPKREMRVTLAVRSPEHPRAAPRPVLPRQTSPTVAATPREVARPPIAPQRHIPIEPPPPAFLRRDDSDPTPPIEMPKVPPLPQMQVAALPAPAMPPSNRPPQANVKKTVAAPTFPPAAPSERPTHARVSSPDPIASLEIQSTEAPLPPAATVLSSPIAAVPVPLPPPTSSTPPPTPSTRQPSPAPMPVAAATPGPVRRRGGDPNDSLEELRHRLTAPPSDLTASSAVPARNWSTLPPLGQRTVPERMDLVLRRGGSARTEQAVANALTWLAAHQHPDGFWDSDRFHERCPDEDRCTGPAIETESDTGLTGLALLAFLGAGHTHRISGRYSANIQRGLDWLVRTQRSDGDLREGGRVYCHSMATLAMTEALIMTHDEGLRSPARAAIEWLCRAQHAETGGWRYGPGEPGDSSVFGWALLALHSGRTAAIAIPAGTWERAGRWLPQVSHGQHGGLVAYRPGYEPSHAMTAESIVCRQILGSPHDDPALAEGAQYLLKRIPAHDDYHLYYWYYGTLGLFQYGGEAWRVWNEAMTATLLATQEAEGHRKGSWEPRRPFGVDGGRIFATAASALCLEVYYRYLPLYLSPTGTTAATGPTAPSVVGSTQSP